MTITFHEEWMGTVALERLAQLASVVTDLDGCAVEIGTWEGRSFLTIASILDGPLHAIDTFAGSDTDNTKGLAQARDVLGIFRANLDAAGLSERTTVWPHDWREVIGPDALKPWPWPIRFAHIDADHAYQEVADTIIALQPLIVPGGLIVGDDALDSGVARAVADTIGWGQHPDKARQRGATWWWVKS